jgi:gluconolactonase
MPHLSRRAFGAGAAALLPTAAFAADAAAPVFGTSPSVVSNPPRQWGADAPPMMYPDPDIITLDPSFRQLTLGLVAIHRIATGYQWAEGPAWSSQGQYAIFSDVKGDTQYRYIWETGQVSAFRKPSYNSNGNSFDFEGRELSCQDFNRRVVRWENDGSMTVIADNFEGKPLNSPNDIVAHPDGSIWFTDPYFGGSNSEGHANQAGGRGNANGAADPRLGVPGSGIIGGMDQVLDANVYRWDPSGKLELVLAKPGGPNGLCFSPDYKTLYLINSGRIVAGAVSGRKVGPLKPLIDCMIDGVRCGPDGMRADKAGNLWVSSNAPLGYAGVTVWSPAGKAIGRIRLPEVCANLCFAGPKRDWLFMTASQSIYMLRLGIQGAAPG